MSTQASSAFPDVPDRKIVRFTIDVPGLSASWEAVRSKRRVWVAVCAEQNATVEGNTLPETKRAADEAMRLIVEDEAPA